MTDETTRIPDGDNDTIESHEPVEQTPDFAPDWSLYSTDGSAQDIDAALAAVAALSEPVTEQEAEEIAIDAAPRKRVGAYAPALAMPPMSRLKRGQPGSVVPALVLIGLGGWLTLTTTSGGSIDPLLLITGVIGGSALSLIAYWLGSGRWSRGTLLFGVLIALTLVLILAALQGGLAFYPLLIASAGVGLIAAGVLSRPAERRAFVPGLLLILGGGAGLLASLGIVPTNLLPPINIAAPVLAILVLILLLLPRLRRR